MPLLAGLGLSIANYILIKSILEPILKKHLDNYYDSLIEYKHVASRMNTIFLKDIERYTLDDAVLNLASSLVLQDWSGGNR